MQIEYKIEQNDIKAVNDICEKMKDSELVLSRKNSINDPTMNAEILWKAILLGLLTSQQKSSPESPSQKIINSSPFVFSLTALKENENDLENYIGSVFKKYSGIRFQKKLTNYIIKNRNKLIRFYDILHKNISELISSENATKDQERILCNQFQNYFIGIGPKQSRNALQYVGILRYEIPIDSRMIKWVNKNLDIGLPLNSVVISDLSYYEYYLDKIQSICERAKILPTIFDASVFASFDE